MVKKIISFYLSGFKSMTLGKSLWILILIKLFIIFAILKLFFFKDYLDSNFKSDKEKSEHVFENLTNKK